MFRVPWRLVSLDRVPPCPVPPSPTWIGRHYLSNARPHSFYACFVVSRTIMSCYIILPLLQSVCVGQVVLDEWLPLMQAHCWWKAARSGQRPLAADRRSSFRLLYSSPYTLTAPPGFSVGDRTGTHGKCIHINYVCVHVYIYIYVYIYTHHMYIYIYIDMCICIHIYIYTHSVWVSICIHIYIYIERERER